jgi:hypothetical protein
MQEAVYLPAKYTPKRQGPTSIFWHHTNDLTDHHTRFGLIRANLARRAPFAPPLGPSLDYRGWASDRSDKSGEVQYRFSFDVQTNEVFSTILIA